MKSTNNNELLLIGEAARLLDLSDERVRQLTRAGHLSPIRSGKRGIRIFHRDDVLRLKREREKREEANGCR